MNGGGLEEILFLAMLLISFFTQILIPLIVLKLKTKKIFRPDIFSIFGVGLLMGTISIVLIVYLRHLTAYIVERYSLLFVAALIAVHTILLTPLLKKENKKLSPLLVIPGYIIIYLLLKYR